MPKFIMKRIFIGIKDLTNPLEISGTIKRNLHNEFFKTNFNFYDQLMEKPNEVILSERFVK